MLDWYKPDGGLKDMSAVLPCWAWLKMGLSPCRHHGVNHPRDRKSALLNRQPPQPAILRPVHELAALQLCPVTTRDQSRLWNEYIHRYHYLGHKPLSGAQLRYFVTLDEQIIAVLGFGAAAW